MKQQALYKIVGMQRDVADSGMDKQHAYDLHNVRLRNSDTNTITAIVNELGNKKAKTVIGTTASVRGTIIGFNTLNNVGILFTHEESGKGYIDPGYITSNAEQSTNTRSALRSPSEEIEDATDRLCDFTVDSVQHYGSFEHEIINTVNGTATITVVITKFHNTDYYATGGSADSEKVYISTEDLDVSLTHDTTGSMLSLSQEEIIAVNDEDNPVPYVFTINFNIQQSLQAQIVHKIIEIKPYTGFPSTVRIGFQLSIPALVTPESDPEIPEHESEIEVPTNYEVICDYKEELNLSQCDHIYLVTVNTAQSRSADSDYTLNVFEYFRGCLNFDAEHPIESTVYFENSEIQKIYWVDGFNPLRYANIAHKNGSTFWSDNLMFDSVPLLHLQEHVKITRNTTGGVFPSCTVQWCFTYLNRYGAESNIAWISPIHYSSPDDRGGAPGENCSNSFTIKIDGYEPNGRFDYIRLYSIVHTTLDAEVQVRRIADLAIPAEKVSTTIVDEETEEEQEVWYYPSVVFTDSNTTGETVDPNELLYLGGLSVIPSTIEQKSNTLFLGNLKQSFDQLRDVLTEQGTMEWGKGEDDVTFDTVASNVPEDVRSGYYSHQNQLVSDSWNITSFRRGEVYRFGFQAQDKTGHWSDVWWICDKENTDAYPTFSNDYLNTVQASCTVPSTVVTKLRESGYQKIRPVVVYPEPWERNIYTEGLLNPTVYNVKDRASNAPFAQSSWFLRPFSPINLPTIKSGSTAIGNFGNLSGMVFPETTSFISKLILQDSESQGQTIDNHLWRDGMSFLAIDSPYYTVGSEMTLMSVDLSKYGSWAEFRHNHPLGDSQQRNGEIQSMYNLRVGEDSVSTRYSLTFPYTSDFDDNRRTFVNNWADFFYVDQSIFTMNSADIEFDQVLQAQTLKDYKFRIVGIVPITSFISSYDITTNTPPNKFFNKDNNSLLIPQGFYGSEIVGANMEQCGHGWKSLISGSYWHDDLAYNSFWKVSNANYNNDNATPVGFAVYPWQGTGSLNNDSVGTRRTYPSGNDNDAESKSATGDNYISAELKSKTLANLHYSYCTHQLKHLSRAVQIGAKVSSVLDEQGVSLTKIDKPAEGLNGVLHYFGSVDKLITPMTSGFMSIGTVTEGGTPLAASSDSRLSRKGGYPKMASSLPYLMHGFATPGSSSGHLAFTSPYTPVGYPNVLFGDDYFTSIPTPYPHDGADSGWLPHDMKDGADRSMSSIQIKYKSCNHFVVALDYAKESSSVYQKCLGWFGASSSITNDSFGSAKMPFWCSGLSGYKCVTPFTHQESETDNDLFNGVYLWNIEGSYTAIEFNNSEHDSKYFSGYLYMGQLYRDTVTNRFGGNSDEALEQNVWLPAGEAVYLKAGESAQLVWQAGDTYYQRYDALRTYPFTEEDVNKVVDIVSFMTETHINIDGRYDKNRGLTNNNHCRPTNFNKMNYVYSQRDNFFTYHALNPKKVHLDTFNYSFTWSLTKTAGALRDEWTRVTLANTYDCDGNKGSLNSITRLDNNLVAFQDGGVAQILFNENVQIQGSEGVPIELANSGKMQGLRYYTTEIGCQNKWSIAVMPNGIYWIDGRSQDFCMLGEGITSVSTTKLMATWFRNRSDLITKWAPISDNWTGFFTHRDITTNELFITSYDACLCYDTLVGEFTSFYDYQKTDAMFTLDGVVITAAKDRSKTVASGIVLNDNLWLHRANKETSCCFYGNQYPFWVEIVCNSNNQGSDYGLTKIFDNMSWRSDVWEWNSDDSWTYKPFITVTSLSGKDNYQTFSQEFTNTYQGDKQTSHPTMPINLRKKFKVWYTTIPRSDESKTEARPTGTDRIRDTWCHIRLTANTSVSAYRHIIHDLSITYFIP